MIVVRMVGISGVRQIIMRRYGVYLRAEMQRSINEFYKSLFPFHLALSGVLFIALLIVVIRLRQLSLKKNKLIISAKQRLSIQSKYIHLIYDATMLSANTEDLYQSMNACLNLICKTIGWPIGHIYVVSSENRSILESSHMWYLANAKKVSAFKKYTEKTTFAKGVGLPGRVWKSRQAVWISDVTHDENFLRELPSRQIGLQSAVAFPVLANKKLIAVFEFFSYDKQKYDDELLCAFEVMTEQIGRIFERKISKNHLNFIAHHDSLTGVSNRIQFDAVAKKALAYAIRYHKLMAILLMDLDFFKTVNDSLGHEIGDLLLQGVTKRFLSVLRDADTLARFGGDEFAVIIDHIEKQEDVLFVANKLIEAMHQPFMLKENEITISVSIGVAIYPDAGNTLELLKRNSDSALYKAKKAGRDRFFVYKRDENRI